MRRWPIAWIIAGCLAMALFARESFGQTDNNINEEFAEPVAPVDEPADDFGPIESTRQMFSALDMTPEQFAKFKDNTPLAADDAEAIVQTLHALSQFPADRLHRWTKRDVDAAQLRSGPDKFRGELVHLAGRLSDSGVFEVPEELAERFDVALVRRCDVTLQDGSSVTVLTETVPRDVKAGDAVSFDGVFLKTADSNDDKPPALVFASQRLAWHPATELGKLGMDVGRLEEVTQDQPISGQEAAAFYEMLAAVGHANVNDLLAATREQHWTIIPPTSDRTKLEATLAKLKDKDPSLEFYLVSDPENYAGRLMAMEGQVYRCVRVPITNRELAARLGFDHYYNLVLFVDLDYKLTIGSAEVAAKKAEGGRPVFTEVRTYPVAVCLRELPPGFPTGDKLKERVRVPGCFFKQWPYRSTSAAVLHPNRPELSPLLIGRSLQWLSPPKPTDSKLQVIISAAFVVLLALLCFTLWYAGRRDRKFREGFLTKTDEPTFISPPE